MRHRVSCLVVSALALLATPMRAQTAGPAFEVASIKINTNPQAPRFYQAANDRLSIGNVTLRMLIPLAYGVDPDQISGGPEWIDKDRFDILAKAAVPFAPETQWRAMLRTLLVDRFRLVVRREARPIDVLALVRVRQDGPLGNDLRRAATTCEELAKASPPPADSCGLVAANRADATGRMSVRGLPMDMLTRLLSGEVEQPVRDETGLAGAFDWDLVFTPRRTPEIDANAPSIFTAVQEQLGLKLEARRGTRDVIVIEQVERPIPD
jgi:uncharacterized protein (TIGR03435 family)